MAAKTGKKTHTLAAFGVSLLLNGALLASMAFGVRALAPPPESEAVRLFLLPAILTQPLARIQPPQAKAPPQKAQGAKAAAAPAQATVKVLTRPPQTNAAPGVVSGAAPVPAQIAEPPLPHINMGPGDGVEGVIKESVGCDDPDAYHLTKAQRAACVERLTGHAKAAPNLAGINVAPDKWAAFDRDAKCREANRGGAMPSPDDSSDGVTGIKGLGPIQRLRDCPPSTR